MWSPYYYNFNQNDPPLVIALNFNDHLTTKLTNNHFVRGPFQELTLELNMNLIFGIEI